MIAMEPYLSIVVCSFDDAHHEMQGFMTATLDQCRRFQISSELIIVEWKRPEGLAPLAGTLTLPKGAGPTTVRVIEVSEEAYGRHRNGGGNSIEQAIAKNTGIRRATGRFILTPETPRLLPDELMQFIGGLSRRFCSLEWDDIAAKDGSLGLGKGWFWKEMDGSKPFRWFNNDAEIYIHPNRDSARVLALDIEPGPGVNMGPTTLDVLDDEGANVLSVRLANRRVVNVPLPDGELPVR